MGEKSMRLIMTQQISGSRGNDTWPLPGGALVCGEAEGRKLINMGVAVEAEGEWPPPEEHAVYEPPAEERSRVMAPPPAPGVVESDRAAEAPKQPSPLEDVAPRRRPGRPRNADLPNGGK